MTTLRDELLRIYRDSGLQARLDELVANTAEELLARVLPPQIAPGGPYYQPPPAAPSPPAPPSPYTVLGVDRGDPMPLIESVYHAKAKHLHPDVATGNAQRFIALQEAYEQIRRERRHAS